MPEVGSGVRRWIKGEEIPSYSGIRAEKRIKPWRPAFREAKSCDCTFANGGGLDSLWEGGEVLPGPPGLICSLTGSPISGRQ